MTRALERTYDLAQEYRMQMACLMLGACALIIFIYAWNVYSVISHTVAIEKMQKNIAALSAQVDAVDQAFLQLSSKASPDALAAHGLSEGQVTAYISPTTSLGALSMRSHEL
ncbi:MAG: hypothetical protein KGI59_00500 [Patescibacteria group bacterium]|nr:hypothetical protein [Patescibacteria group bacterium]MDE2172890.1 hypothetical protein [Patescibacteria group bacterium]